MKSLLTLNGAVSQLETVLAALLAASAVVTDVATNAGVPAHVVATVLGALGIISLIVKAATGQPAPPAPNPPPAVGGK
jgi:hypothetical protein